MCQLCILFWLLALCNGPSLWACMHRPGITGRAHLRPPRPNLSLAHARGAPCSVGMPSISRRTELPRYMSPRSNSPAVRRTGEDRRARRPGELRAADNVGRYSAESWQATVVPPVLSQDPTPPPRPYEAVPASVRQGWDREGEELGWWGGMNRQLHHMDEQQAEMHRLQGELRAERRTRREALASREDAVMELCSARQRIALLEAELHGRKPGLWKPGRASSTQSAHAYASRPASSRSTRASAADPPRPTSSPRLSFARSPSGERLCPAHMRRFSSSTWAASGELGDEESVKAQHDMELLLRMIRNRQGSQLL